MKPWSPDPSRQSCVCHYGNMRQLCGLTRYEFLDGKAKGVEAVDVETGGGLSFTILPGRGMDISGMRYRGVPIAYLSKAEVAAPGYHDPRENQWLKSFFAGMLTTCGLTNAGPACRDGIGILDDVPFGLHGDISNTGADNVCVREEWVQGALSDGGIRPGAGGASTRGAPVAPPQCDGVPWRKALYDQRRV